MVSEQVLTKEATKIIVCYHKDCHIFKNNVLLPIHVGRDINPDKLPNLQGDNDGQSISYKNKYYCELTGLYWLWKNVDADNYGLFHYRRFLDLKGKYSDRAFCSELDLNDWSEDVIADEMSNYDVIMAKPLELSGETVYEHYNHYHVIEDLNLILYIISKDFPEYEDAADFVMQRRDLNIGNLFIMKKNLFFDYCKWLFAIMSTAESLYEYKSRSPYQQRSLAFLAERLFNIFIQHQINTNPDFKVNYVNLIEISEDM